MKEEDHGVFFFLSRKKEKIIQRNKKCREGSHLTFLLSLLHLG
jgi:ribosomal protein L24E